MTLNIGLIGFGEAGQSFARGWTQAGLTHAVRAFDIKTNTDSTADAKRADYDRLGVHGCNDLKSAVAGVDVVFSFVTADCAHDAARDAAGYLTVGTIFFDCNSCAPDTKRASAKVVEQAGAKYIDMAVMAPVHPRDHKTPVLISATHDVEHYVTELGLAARAVSDEVGKASSIKMMRSVMIKGLEALTAESLLAARRAGVDAEVIASLDASFPDWNWAAKAGYNLERTTTHGLRRAAEMREVAKTVSDLGLDNGMSRAIVDWQQSMGDLGLDLSAPDFETRADTILNALKESS